MLDFTRYSARFRVKGQLKGCGPTGSDRRHALGLCAGIGGIGVVMAAAIRQFIVEKRTTLARPGALAGTPVHGHHVAVARRPQLVQLADRDLNRWHHANQFATHGSRLRLDCRLRRGLLSWLVNQPNCVATLGCDRKVLIRRGCQSEGNAVVFLDFSGGTLCRTTVELRHLSPMLVILHNKHCAYFGSLLWVGSAGLGSSR